MYPATGLAGRCRAPTISGKTVRLRVLKLWSHHDCSGNKASQDFPATNEISFLEKQTPFQWRVLSLCRGKDLVPFHATRGVRGENNDPPLSSRPCHCAQVDIKRTKSEILKPLKQAVSCLIGSAAILYEPACPVANAADIGAFHAPFDSASKEADAALLGATPGKQQREAAVLDLRSGLLSGGHTADAPQAAIQAASFG